MHDAAPPASKPGEGEVLRGEPDEIWKAANDPRERTGMAVDDWADHYPFPEPDDAAAPPASASLWRREREAGLLYVASPVAFALGAIGYFLAPIEPFSLAAPALVVGLAGALVAFPNWRLRFAPVFLLIAALGFAAADWRTAWLDTRTLADREIMDLRGTVQRTERRANGSVRYTLDVGDASIDRIRFTQRRPGRIFVPGERIAVRVRAEAPSGPIWPGGYDFAFWAWFEGRGAQGFALTQPEPLGGEPSGINALRLAMAERVRSTVPGDAGGLAAALLTGDRAGLSEDAQDAMRASGLAHVLAISGLHMGLLTGLVFWLVRRVVLAASPRAVEWPVKKIAAGVALAAAFAYLLISGMSVSTQRAFVMVAIMLVAVLFDRRALTLRNVATAALMVLAMQPEAVFAPGFQMSFAAVAALVVSYDALRRRRQADRPGGAFAAAARFFGTLALTSLIAGAATAPFALFHFGQIAALGLLANLAAMPVVSLVIMPLILATGLLMPFGLELVALAPLAYANDLLLWVANAVSQMGSWWRPGRLDPPAFAALAAAFTVLIVLRTRLKALALAPLAVAMVLAAYQSDPVAIVQPNGRVALRDGCSLRFSAGNGTSFADRNVVRSFAEQGCEVGPKFECDRLGCAATAEGFTAAVPKTEEALQADCRAADLVVGLNSDCVGGTNRGAARITAADLMRHGAHHVFRSNGATTTRPAYRTERPWTAHRFKRAD